MIFHYVIAGSYNEYRTYMRAIIPKEDTKYVYVSDDTMLRGVENPHGVFIGSWQKHPHIHKIVRNLLVYSRQTNPNLDRVIQILNHV